MNEAAQNTKTIRAVDECRDKSFIQLKKKDNKLIMYVPDERVYLNQRVLKELIEALESYVEK